MWHDYLLGQRNKTTERSMRVQVGGNRGGWGWTKFEKEGWATWVFP